MSLIEVFIPDSSRPGRSSFCVVVWVLCSQMNSTVASVSKQKLQDRGHAKSCPFLLLT